MSNLSYHSAKVFATGTADRKFCIFEENRHCARNAAHPTSENGKLAALTSGRPAFQQHTKRTEGSDTTPTSYTQKVLSAGCTSHNSDKSKKRLRSPAGLRRLGTATRISASLSRRLFVSFRSASDQDPKAAKFAVLIPGPGMFVNVRNVPRVVIAPPSGRPLFRRVSRCVRSCWRRRVCTRFCLRKQTWAVCARS